MSEWDLFTNLTPEIDERVESLEAFFRLFTNKQRLGTGASRGVYLLDNPLIKGKWVAKFSTTNQGGIDQNVDEYNTWWEVKDTEYAKWFAPVISGTSDGRVIIQKYIPDIKPHQIPDKIPAFFTDTKEDNWGYLKGQPICRDYGHTLLRTTGLTRRMKRW